MFLSVFLIIELCKCYGIPVDNKVNYEKLYKNRNKGMMGSTRWVEMELKAGVFMNNFYWFYLEMLFQGSLYCIADRTSSAVTV